MLLEISNSAWMIGIISGLISAFFSGLAGYYFAHRLGGKNLTADLILSVTSDQFTERRDRMQELLRDPKLNLKSFADFNNDKDRQDRRSIMRIFNRYEMICQLKHSGVLDKPMFDEHLFDIIAEDFDLVNAFFAAFEADQIAKGLAMRRPFFPNIRQALFE